MKIGEEGGGRSREKDLNVVCLAEFLLTITEAI